MNPLDDAPCEGEPLLGGEEGGELAEGGEEAGGEGEEGVLVVRPPVREVRHPAPAPPVLLRRVLGIVAPQFENLQYERY